MRKFILATVQLVVASNIPLAAAGGPYRKKIGVQIVVSNMVFIWTHDVAYFGWHGWGVIGFRRVGATH